MHRYSDDELNGLLAHAIRAARIGGQVDHAAFGSIRSAQVEQKADTRWNPVTEIDRRSETAVTGFLGQAYPDHSFLGEENVAGQDHTADQIWIIDPIDGTANFIHGIPHYAVSVGFARAGTVLVAACLDVERDELFTAVRGRGAWLNGQPLPRRDGADAGLGSLSDAMVCTGFYYDRDAMMERTLNAIRELFRAQIHGLRRSGSAVLDICWTAAGRYDAFFEHELGAWDYAAASLVAEECGIRLAASDGSPLTLASGSVACSTPAIFDELMKIVGPR